MEMKHTPTPGEICELRNEGNERERLIETLEMALRGLEGASAVMADTLTGLAIVPEIKAMLAECKGDA